MIEDELRSAKALYIYNYTTIMSPFKKFAVVSDGKGAFAIKNVQTGKLGKMRWDSPRDAGMFLANEVAKRNAQAKAPTRSVRPEPAKRSINDALETAIDVLTAAEVNDAGEQDVQSRAYKTIQKLLAELDGMPEERVVEAIVLY